MLDVETWKFLLAQGGLAVLAGAAVMAWRAERTERMEANKNLFAVGTRSVEGNFTLAASIDKLTDSVNARRS